MIPTSQDSYYFWKTKCEGIEVKLQRAKTIFFLNFWSLSMVNDAGFSGQDVSEELTSSTIGCRDFLFLGQALYHWAICFHTRGCVFIKSRSATNSVLGITLYYNFSISYYNYIIPSVVLSLYYRSVNHWHCSRTSLYMRWWSTSALNKHSYNCWHIYQRE